MMPCLDKRWTFPLPKWSLSYAAKGSRARGESLNNVIVDLAKPPSGVVRNPAAPVYAGILRLRTFNELAFLRNFWS